MKALTSRQPAALRTVMFASLVGTTIEYFDFYVYATAAVLIFPKLFFPATDPTAATLHSLETFALAFFARPLGSALFGHFGDRLGRKATLVATLLTMGISTALIGVLPVYAAIGAWAPALLALCRVGQGLGLGGEWGGAVLLAVESAPANRRALYGMLPQFGAPVGFFCATGLLLVLSQALTEAQLLDWGWRIPFLASALLVVLGSYVRLRLPETAEFQRMSVNAERVQWPLWTTLTRHFGSVVLGTLAATTLFVSFYLMTVFSLSWGTSHLGYTRTGFLCIEMIGMVAATLTVALSGPASVRFGAMPFLLVATLAVLVFGGFFARLFSSGDLTSVLWFSVLGLSLAGLQYGPLGTVLAQLYPTSVRYTGISLSFNLAGILGASLTPYIATGLATKYGLAAVGDYLCAAACLSALALLFTGNGNVTRHAK
jgi:MFS family permease